MIVGNSKCYNVVLGNYYHDQGVQSVTEFGVSNMKPGTIICNYDELDALIWPKNLSKIGAVGDIWSPVEDIANEAVKQITSAANQAIVQIDHQLKVFQKTITDQIHKVSDTVQKESAEISPTVTEQINTVTSTVQKKLLNYLIQWVTAATLLLCRLQGWKTQLSKKLEYLNDGSIILCKYLIIGSIVWLNWLNSLSPIYQCRHIFEFFEECLVLYWLYQLDRKTIGVRNLLKWIW